MSDKSHIEGIFQMTKRQWQEVFTIVRREQKGLLESWDEDRYDELSSILDELYPIAYGGENVR